MYKMHNHFLIFLYGARLVGVIAQYIAKNESIKKTIIFKLDDP